MALRSVWKGFIKFSLLTIPVKMFKAVDDSEEIHFNELHRECGGRVGRENKCKKCGGVPVREEIVKGYEVGPDEYVQVEKAELDAIKLVSTKMIEIQGFVAASDIHPTLFEVPNFIAPDGMVAQSAFGLLVATLQKSGKVGVGRVVMRGREEVVALAPYGEVGLVAYGLRNPEQVRKLSDVPGLQVTSPKPEEVKLAEKLVDSMTVSLDQIDLRDRYRDVVRNLIVTKQAGGTVVAVPDAPVATATDLMSILQQSVEQASAQVETPKKRKVAAFEKSMNEEAAAGKKRRVKKAS